MVDATDLDKVRLLISDVGGHDGNTFLFNDNEINTFLALRTDPILAAVLALRTIAGNEAQTQKAIQYFDLKTNGPATAKALMDQAAALEQSVADDSDFEIAELAVNQFSRRYLRGFTV